MAVLSMLVVVQSSYRQHSSLTRDQTVSNECPLQKMSGDEATQRAPSMAHETGLATGVVAWREWRIGRGRVWIKSGWAT